MPSAPKKPLTIGHFTDNYGPASSGLLYAVQFLEERALIAGHRVLLVAPEANGPNPHASNPERREIRLPSVPVPGMQVRISMGQDFEYRLSQIVANPPDVVHVHGLGPVGLLGMWVAQQANKPLLVTWHTDMEAYAEHYWHLLPFLNAVYQNYTLRQNKSLYQQSNKRFKHPRRGGAQVALLQLASQMLTEADLVTAPSDKTGNRVLEIAPESKVRVLPNGTDALPELPPISKSSGPRLLFVGRIAAEKGLDLLLDAFALVRDQIPTAELMIVGNWQQASIGLRTRLRRAARFGGVILIGHTPREKLGAYYSSADIFVFPSVTDTQALVLHEAAHVGLPLVMCDDELRLVADPGVNAFFAQNDATSLAEAITSMLSELKDPVFAAKAKARSKELAAKYTIENQSDEVLSIYEALAAGKPVEPTPDLTPKYGRRIFPTRKVTIGYQAPLATGNKR